MKPTSPFLKKFSNEKLATSMCLETSELAMTLYDSALNIFLYSNRINKDVLESATADIANEKSTSETNKRHIKSQIDVLNACDFALDSIK